MKRKIYLLFYLQIVKIIFGDELNLYLKNEYTNIIHSRTDNIKADIYSNITSLKVEYIDEDLRLLFSLSGQYSYINIDGFDTDNFAPLTFNSNKITSKNLSVIPDFKLSYKESWIEFDSEKNYSFNFDIPILNNLAIGAFYSNINRDFKINLLDTYEILLFPIESESSIYGDMNLGLWEIQLYTSSKTINIDPFISEKESLSIDFSTKSSYSFGGEINRKNSINSFLIKGEITNYPLDSYAIKGYNYKDIFGGSAKSESSISFINSLIMYTRKNLSFEIFHNQINIAPMDFYLDSSTFIYGIVAFRKYNYYFPEINIYDTGFNITFKNNTKKGSFIISSGYRRIYTDLSEVEYFYRDCVWNLLGYSVIGSKTVFEKIKYDHINIINLDINHSIDITDNISLNSGVSQLIPFFDIEKNRSSAISESAASSNRNYIWGGFSFTLELKLSL